MRVLVLSHPAHSVVGSEDRVGRTVLLVSLLVVVPHVPPQPTVTNGLQDVAGHHAIRGSLVPRCLAFDSREGSNDVTHTVGNEDTTGSDDTFGV